MTSHNNFSPLNNFFMLQVDERNVYFLLRIKFFLTEDV